MSRGTVFSNPALPRLEGVASLLILYLVFLFVILQFGQLFFEDSLFLSSLYQPIYHVIPFVVLLTGVTVILSP